MKKTFQALPLFAFVLFLALPAGCDDGGIVDYGPTPVFAMGHVQIEVDHKKGPLDTTITITARCIPLFTGEGELSLSGLCLGGSSWILEQPYRDTLPRLGTSSTIPAQFTAGDTLTQRWTVRLTSDKTCMFDVWAVMSRIFDSTSNQMIRIDSRGLIERSPGGRGYDERAYSGKFYFNR